MKSPPGDLCLVGAHRLVTNLEGHAPSCPKYQAPTARTPSIIDSLSAQAARFTLTTMQDLPFDQRACFVAGAAKSGTTLLVSLLDSHPELLVMPQDTAYFATVLTKYGSRGRRAQFDYLTKESWTNVLFGFQARRGKQDYAGFPKQAFLETFERTAFDPANATRDLLVLMMESYAKVLGLPLERVKRWVEKTPANRNYIPAIFTRFPQAKLLVTMRDPRALLAAQIALEKTRKTRRFSVYYVIAHWLVAAKLAKKVGDGDVSGLVVGYEEPCAGSVDVDAKGVRLSRDRFRSGGRSQSDKGRQLMVGQLGRGRSVFRDQRRTGNAMAARVERR